MIPYKKVKLYEETKALEEVKEEEQNLTEEAFEAAEAAVVVVEDLVTERENLCLEIHQEAVNAELLMAKAEKRKEEVLTFFPRKQKKVSFVKQYAGKVLEKPIMYVQLFCSVLFCFVLFSSVLSCFFLWCSLSVK